MRKGENELLVHTNKETPMGDLFRRYWLPAFTINELPYPGCPQIRLPILGEKLIAYRNKDGKVVVLEESCAHRQASLFFGHCEDGGIRCPYHGWKFDDKGKCVDIPSEASGSGYEEHIQIKAYPTIEKGGVVWIYMGPRELTPDPPCLEWSMLPEENLFVSRRLQECNYLQTMEGGLDSSHLSWLHGGTVLTDPVIGLGMSNAEHDSEILKIIANDRNPHYQTISTEGGLLLGARRNAGKGKYYWRVTQFISPCFNIIAPTGASTINAQVWVPMDDENCWSWAINYHMERPLTNEERDAMHLGGGLHVNFMPGTHQCDANFDNNYHIDRAAQRRGDSFTGIPSFSMQDAAIQESQGKIADRTLENLVSSDNGILVTRQMLLNAIKNNQAGSDIPGLDPSGHLVRASSLIVAEDNLEKIDRALFRSVFSESNK